MKKTALFFGGRSAEHDVSVASAAHVLPLLRCKGMDIFPVYIDKNGSLHTFLSPCALQEQKVQKDTLIPLSITYTGGAPFVLNSAAHAPFIPERILSLLHGSYGEDGAWQGFFTLCGIPFVGCSVLSSALAMHKPTAKDLARQNGVPTLPYVSLFGTSDTPLRTAENTFGYPFFVKPASGGSSLGASRVASKDALDAALRAAFRYDSEVMIEPFVHASELSVAILERNGEILLSSIGETKPQTAFYDYTAKYESDTADFLCPAPLCASQEKEITEYATLLFRTFRCRHMARIDFLKTEQGTIYFNEINTIPGFTAHSLYAKLFAAKGIDALSLFAEDTL